MKIKLTFIFFFLSFLFSAVIVKAFYVQIFNQKKLLAYANSQIVREIKAYPRRGHILDRNGSPMAINFQKFNLSMFPKNKISMQKDLSKLKTIVPSVNVDFLINKNKKRMGRFTWIKRKVDLSEKQLVEIKKIKSIIVDSQVSRLYPNNEVGSQLLGFVGIDNDGLSGIEYFFNDSLKGEAQIHKYYKDAKGRPIKYKSKFVESKAQDIELSIDKDIQSYLETSLKAAVLKHKALKAGAAVMDAQTGEIWAIANYPTFDPNKYSKSKKNTRKLSFITDPIEPGSIFKALTIASALEHNIVKPDTSYYCEKGKFLVGNHYIKESDSNHKHEWLNVNEILKFSSNVGTTKIAFDLTYPRLKETLDKFRIGQKTQVEFPAESRGILDKEENIEPLRLSNISFGQGVATTGLQMLSAYAAFANGGYWVKPSLVKLSKKDVERERIISKTTANQVSKMLLDAVESGTGSRARVKHFEIAGKTSTAQRADSRGGYTGYISGFIGYPINVDKRFVVYVYIDNPKKGYYGNTVAGPVFSKIVKNILYKRKEYNRLAKYESNKSLDTVNYRRSSKIYTGKGLMPNLLGLDKVNASRILTKLNLDSKIKGFGVVSDQFPKAGATLSKNVTVKLRFSAPSYD